MNGGSEPVLLLFLTAAILLAARVPYELKVSQPMVNLRTSGRRPVLMTNVASLLIGFAMFANMLLTTQQLQLPTATATDSGERHHRRAVHGPVRTRDGDFRACFRTHHPRLRRQARADRRRHRDDCGYVSRVFFYASIAWVISRALVFRVLMRRERGTQEPWATIPFAVLDSPDPEAARTDIRERYLATTARLIGDTTPERRFASTVVALMTGFGATVRTLGLFRRLGL